MEWVMLTVGLVCVALAWDVARRWLAHLDRSIAADAAGQETEARFAKLEERLRDHDQRLLAHKVIIEGQKAFGRPPRIRNGG